MLDYVGVFFILLGGAGGYIAPLTVKNPPCGFAGTVVGVIADRETNPTELRWPDPYFPETHCRVDVRDYVANLAPGTYEIATTEFTTGVGGPPYIGIDPHTRGQIDRQTGNEPGRPTRLRVVIGPNKGR